jgi:hypothetical protein
MAFIVTVFREDDSDRALDAFSGDYEEVISSMDAEDYPGDLLDKIDDATRKLDGELPSAQRTVWHYPYSVEVRKV